MTIQDLLTTDLVIHNLEVASKKKTLDHISSLISNSVQDLEHDTVFTGLIERERLGSTGIGEGVAIPHCRLDETDKAIAVFIKLNEAVDFDAIDKAPVDLVFALVVPSNSAEEHLNTLAQLAELFSSAQNREALRSCENQTQLYNTLMKLTG
ncbi:PTS sugar transporter subunit IIA [Gammaproteobacteria bacterium AS21]|jgi:PTS system nitrogen regulatory IIA component